MAQQGRRLDEQTRRQVVRLAAVLSVRKAAREADVAPNTVVKYARKARDGKK